MDSNLFWCVAGIIGGAIFSFLISYLFYFKGLTKKCLTYEINTFCIMSDKINQIEGLIVKYNSDEIKDLYSSTITIKNIGNSIVKSQDFAPSCPISIFASNQFLKSQNQYIESYPVGKKTNYNLSFSRMPYCVEFNFEYIPKKAIIKFSLFHIGRYISFKGDLMEGEIIPANALKSRKITIRRIIIFSIEIIILIISVITLILILTTI